MLNNILLAALVILKVYDAWSTNYILSKGGSETNPLVKLFMRFAGVKGGIALDFVLIVGCGFVAYPYPWYFLGVMVAWYVVWMAKQAKQVRLSK